MTREQIPFEIIIRGTMNAYNNDHARDQFSEFTDYLYQGMGELSPDIVITRIGDDEVDVTNIDLYDIDKTIDTFVRALVYRCIGEVMDDIEASLTPASIFKRSDYTELRNRTLQRLRIYRSICDYQQLRYQNVPKDMEEQCKTFDNLLNRMLSNTLDQKVREMFAEVCTKCAVTNTKGQYKSNSDLKTRSE